MKPGKIGTPKDMREAMDQQKADSKVEITTDFIKMTPEKRKFINQKLKEIAEIIAPDIQGIRYIGGFASYMFEAKTNDLTKTKSFFAIEQTDLEGVAEGFCDQAYKQLKPTLVYAYGRALPEKVKRG